MSPSTVVSLFLSKTEKQPAVLNASLVFLLKSTSSHLEVHTKTREASVTEEKMCGEALHSVSPTLRWKSSHCFIALPCRGWQRQGWVGSCTDFRVTACSCLPCFHLHQGDTEPRAGTTSCPSPPSSKLMREAWVPAYALSQ